MAVGGSDAAFLPAWIVARFKPATVSPTIVAKRTFLAAMKRECLTLGEQRSHDHPGDAFLPLLCVLFTLLMLFARAGTPYLLPPLPLLSSFFINSPISPSSLPTQTLLDFSSFFHYLSSRSLRQLYFFFFTSHPLSFFILLYQSSSRQPVSPLFHSPSRVYVRVSSLVFESWRTIKHLEGILSSRPMLPI